MNWKKLKDIESSKALKDTDKVKVKRWKFERLQNTETYESIESTKQLDLEKLQELISKEQNY